MSDAAVHEICHTAALASMFAFFGWCGFLFVLANRSKP